MKTLTVRILQGVAGLHEQWGEDELIEMPEEKARIWADGIRGEPVGWSNTNVETSMRAAPENAARRTGRLVGR